MKSPSTLQRFAYAATDPVDNVDPSGSFILPPSQPVIEILLELQKNRLRFGAFVPAKRLQDPLRYMSIREGRRSNTFGKVRNGGTTYHQGWDLAGDVGTPVFAIADGSIESVRPEFSPAADPNCRSYGKHVLLRFQDGLRRTRYAFYAHLDQVFVESRDLVLRGKVLGTIGETGNARPSCLPTQQPSPHLHFEFRSISFPDPYDDPDGLDLPLYGRIDPREYYGEPPGVYQ